MRIHRQNPGSVEVVRRGKVVGTFNSGLPNGIADLGGIVKPGYRIEIEVKAAKTKTREAQDNWAAMVRAMGGIYVRVRYDEKLTMEENVACAVQAIEQAVEARRGTGKS